MTRTRLTLKDMALFKRVIEGIAAGASSVVSDIRNGFVMNTPNGPIVMKSGEGQNLEMSGPYMTAVTQARIRSDYADTMLVTALRNVGFTWQGSLPMGPVLARELGGGVEHTFYDGQGRPVSIGRATDGRLHFDFGDGYSEYDAQKAADIIVIAMNQAGLASGPVTINKRSERWLEERLPDRQAESE